MKTFPALFAAEKNRKQGAAPVWILKLQAGGVDYYISDNAFIITPWGVTTKAWGKSWGNLTEGISGLIDEFKISDYSLTCKAVPTDSPNIADLALAYNLEKDLCYLYQWYYGCADPPQEFFRGYVRDYPLSEGDTICNLRLQDESLKWQGAYVGTRVDLAAYPQADPDGVGKVIPLVFGTVNKLPARAVDAGRMTSIPSALNAGAVSFSVSESTGLTVGKSIRVDDEEMYISGVAGDVLTVTRGYNGTLAAIHQKGAIVWEVKATFSYLAADHAVDGIPKVFGKVGQALLDITAVASRYLGSGAVAAVGMGQLGGQHPSYLGKACVTIPGYITASQAVNLMINDGIGVNDALAIISNYLVSNGTLGVNDTLSLSNGTLGVDDTLSLTNGTLVVNDGIAVTDTISVSNTIGLTDPTHSHTQTGSTQNQSTTNSLPQTLTYLSTSSFDGVTSYSGVEYARMSFSASSIGSPTQMVFSITIQKLAGIAAYPDIIRFAMQGGPLVYSDTTNFKALAQGSSYTFTISITANFGNVIDVFSENTGYAAAWQVTACSRVVSGGAPTTATGTGSTLSGTVAKSGSAAKSGTAALSGNVAKTGTVALSGNVAKSGSVALSGNVSQTGTVDRSGSVTKTGTVTLSGNSVANTLVGDELLVNIVRNVTAPGDVIANLLSTWGAVASFQQIGALPGSYAFNGAITDYRKLIDVIHDLAWQCKSWFRHSMGSAKLIVRTLAPASVKALAACRVTEGKKDHSRTKSEYGETINVINLLYGRDWSQEKSDSAYTGVVKGTDQTSIDNYGRQERPDLFMLDFVSDGAMAQDLLTFYLTFYAQRHWVHTFGTWMYDSELEFADAVTLAFAGNALVQIEEAGFQPGSDTIQIKAVQ